MYGVLLNLNKVGKYCSGDLVKVIIAVYKFTLLNISILVL